MKNVRGVGVWGVGWVWGRRVARQCAARNQQSTGEYTRSQHNTITLDVHSAITKRCAWQLYIMLLFILELDGNWDSFPDESSFVDGFCDDIDVVG